MQTQNHQWQNLTAGVCYYPEHWPENLWQDDLRRMKDVGISTVRVAEFAWALFEPREGTFETALFDAFLALCEREGISVIFGTPTATPPVWLTEKYPEVLNARRDGTLLRHGGRRHYNYNSTVYRKLSARIVERLARHFGQHPAIVGWQLDNELNCETDEFNSSSDHEAFREFLRKKYGTPEGVNEAWGTVFWSQTYTDWSQIFCPRPVLNGGYNPHLLLDYFRFVSCSCLGFAGMQAQILRKYIKPSDFITTNGLFGHLDNHALQNDVLDVYTYDSYPDFAFELDKEQQPGSLKDRKWSRNLTETRSVCPHFGIMEQQSGAGGWENRMLMPAPRPGQLKLWAMQSVAHGADFISFFRWRTCPFGTETYWQGILDYDNRDNRKLAEVRDFCQTLRAINDVAGAEYVAAFALLKDYDNVWDAEVDAVHARIAKYSEDALFRAAQRTHTPYNIVYITDTTRLEELENYPVLFYPHPMIMTELRAELLQKYVHAGGTLILGCRSGMKDLNGRFVMRPQPGLLRELTGTDVQEFTLVPDGECTGDTPIFNDVLRPGKETKVLDRFTGSYYAGEACLTRRKLGSGQVLHLGSAFSENRVIELLTQTGVIDPAAEFVHMPEAVEFVRRRKGERDFLFLLNYESRTVKVELKRPLWDLQASQWQQGTILLSPFETAVYEVKSGIKA